jgi:pyruvate/2-oxoglutarate dehydrogenase complex dihydrolipoamide dehydrogenase (E3) component
MKGENSRYDCAVIGGGSGGYAAARTAVENGLRTVVIEGGEQIGGLCILRGCMPTKALLQSAEVAHIASKAGVWGINIPEFGVDFPKVMARKDFLIEDFAGYRREQLTRGDRFDFVRSNATFIDPHTVQLGDGSTLQADHFLISTGSKVSPSPIGSLRDVGYITSDEALKLTRLPSSIIVLGGGVVAVEFAQFFSRLGVRTTIIQRSDHLVREFDRDACQTLREAFEAEGIQVYTGTRIESAEKSPVGKKIIFEHQKRKVSVEAEEIFFALGRSPNTAFLNLDRAGVKTRTNGQIIANEHQQTSSPHIFAAGDCTGPFEIVHIAIQQGETAAWNMAHPSSMKSMDYRLITQVVFTDPHVAHVGMTESQATELGIPYKTASYPFNDHGKSMILDTHHGFVKMMAHARSGEILGASCIGPQGGELIHEIIVAMHARMTVHQFMTIPHYHPTLAEIWTYPAEELAEEINPS